MNYGQILTANEDSSVIETEYTPEFKRNLRALAKKYRHIRSDIQPVIRQIQSGSFPGNQIPKTGISPFSKCGLRTVIFIKASVPAIVLYTM